MAKNPIPRLSSQIDHLLHALAGPKNSWLIWTLIKRGKRNHRPAWQRSGYEVPMYDFCRALALGVVEARTIPIDSTAAGGPMMLGAQDVESVYNEAGCRIHVRITELGRAALAAKDLKEEVRKPEVQKPQPKVFLLPQMPLSGSNK